MLLEGFWHHDLQWGSHVGGMVGEKNTNKFKFNASWIISPPYSPSIHLNFFYYFILILLNHLKARSVPRNARRRHIFSGGVSYNYLLVCKHPQCVIATPRWSLSLFLSLLLHHLCVLVLDKLDENMNTRITSRGVITDTLQLLLIYTFMY